METKIYTEKVKKDLSAKLYSDLHYIPGDNLSFLKKSVDKMENDKPDYIFFLGDLINDSKYSINDLKTLLELISRMAKLTKVILVLGNHDQFTKNREGKWVDLYNYELVSALKNCGVQVLQNEYYKDDYINVYGTRFSGSYYEEREPVGQFLDNIKNVKFEDPNLYNVLCEHSPNYTFDSEVVSIYGNLDNVDLTLAGHYHNGCIPWYASKILPGNKGLIDPYMNLIPENSRGEKQITETNYGIISTPLTTFASDSKFHLANKMLYPKVEQNILIKKK